MNNINTNEDTHANHAGHCCGSGCGGCKCNNDMTLSEKEEQFLREIAQVAYLPVAQFVLQSSKSDHLESVALAPVYLVNKDDTMKDIKEMSALLLNMEEREFITIDYDVPLQGFNYEFYENSSIYQFFQETVAEAKAKGQPEYLFDIGKLECGSMAITAKGIAIVDYIDSL